MRRSNRTSASVTSRRGQTLYDQLVGIHTIFLTPFASNGELDLDADGENTEHEPVRDDGAGQRTTRPALRADYDLRMRTPPSGYQA